MADWEEIKRLAADFQRAQLSSTVQRLSERNCIEIVQRLVELDLIEVIYTVDGKEYMTPHELAKEIREELVVRGGRVNVVELAQALNVDFTHVESKVHEIVRTDKGLNLVLGQLIDETYVVSLCEEINDRLQDQGQVTFAELTKHYDLPAEFLSESIHARLGTVIKGRIDDYDRNIIFTQAFVDRHKARIRGGLSALTRPTPLMNMLTQCGLQDRLFHTIVDELISQGRLAGTLSGGRKDKAIFIPDIYIRSQNTWIDTFYQQNGYLEYDAVARLGVSDAKSFIKKRLKAEPLTYLSTCCIGKALIERIDAEIEEAICSSSWVDILPSLPSICSSADANQVAQQCLKSHPEGRQFCDSIVMSQKMLTECSQAFDKLMAQKADKDAKSNMAVMSASTRVAGLDDGSAARDDKREQRRKKAAGGKSGGGTQGREGKTKSTKKKGHKGHEKDDSDDENTTPSGRGREVQFEFMSPEEIQEVLHKDKNLQECPEDLFVEISNALYRPLKKQYQEVACSVFQQSVGSANTAARKKTHGELQEKITGMWTNAKLFEKGAATYAEDIQQQLNKHLLRTICTDITNLVFNAVATEQMMSVSENTQITQEMRLKLLNKLSDDESKNILTKLHASLNEKTLDEFFTQLELICGNGHLEIFLKKPDKKKERQLVFSHRQSLAEQLRQEESPAMVLHLATVLLLLIHTQNVIHAPGRLVPQLLGVLKSYVTEEQHAVLLQCQDLVISQLKKSSEEGSGEGAENGDAGFSSDLQSKVKDIALTARRTTNNNQEGETT